MLYYSESSFRKVTEVDVFIFVKHKSQKTISEPDGGIEPATAQAAQMCKP